MSEETNIQWKDTQEFTVPIESGQVIKVYDADTITIACKLPFEGSPLYRFSVRLAGIDTPEIKGKNVGEEEKTAGKLARDFVHQMAFQKQVKLKNVSNEKYGRILADVYIGDVHLNQLLLDERHAVPYGGQTKQKPASWERYRQTGHWD